MTAPTASGAAANTRRTSADKLKPVSAAPAQASDQVRHRRLRSSELFGPNHEIEIEHGSAIYRLRLTALGKLILTK